MVKPIRLACPGLAANGTICPVIIRHRVAYQHCLIDGRTAGEFEPDGAAANEIAASGHLRTAA